MLVTGASSGVGAAVARRLGAAGADLLVAGRDPEALAATAGASGGRAVAGDLRDLAALTRLAAEADDARVQVAVLNAGVGWAGPLAQMPLSALDEVLGTDLVAPVRLTRLLVPGLLARGGGHLVLTGSVAARTAVPGEAVYSAAKAGLAGFADALRRELAPAVRVTLVTPGLVDTPFFARRGRPYPRAFPRPVPPERVAAAVLRGVERGLDEVFVPGWLRLPARLAGGAPGVYEVLARRFGDPGYTR